MRHHRQRGQQVGIARPWAPTFVGLICGLIAVLLGVIILVSGEAPTKAEIGAGIILAALAGLL